MIHFSVDDRIALFIDGPNLMQRPSLSVSISTTESVGNVPQTGPADPRILLHRTRGRSGIFPIRPLIDWLDYNGYTMVTKPAKEYTDSTGRPRYKEIFRSSWL